MSRRSIPAALAAVALAACGASEAEDAGPQGTYTSAAPETGANEAGNTVDSAMALIAETWRCKAQDNIPIGVLTIRNSGDYKFMVVKNSLWEPKPGDSGNGTGIFGAKDGKMRPLNGPLVDAYGILDMGRETSEWGTRIYLNNDYGTLLHCGLASEEG